MILNASELYLIPYSVNSLPDNSIDFKSEIILMASDKLVDQFYAYDISQSLKAPNLEFILIASVIEIMPSFKNYCY